MPLLSVRHNDVAAGPSDEVSIYYEVHGVERPQDPRPKVLLLMGFGAPGHVWAPQLADLLVAAQRALGEEGGESAMLVCVMDNRGVGASSSPVGWRSYSTEIMARDSLALMDHLGWQQFHLAGHSMGSMIACKLASLQPQRVLSLSLISGTGGRWQAVPQTLAAIWLGVKKLFVRSVHGRAAVDVQFHFSPSLLEETDPLTKQSRRATVVAEYVEAYLEEEEGPGHGMRGQMGAVLRHRLRKRDVKSIQLGQFPVQVIHGRQDILALPKYGEKLAKRLQAPCILLEGGHFVIREQAAAVNALLRSIILGASFANVERYPYIPFKHWVSVVAGHQERAERLAAQRVQQAAEQAERGEGMHERRRSWSKLLGLWRGSSGSSQQELRGGSPQGGSPRASSWHQELPAMQEGEQQPEGGGGGEEGANGRGAWGGPPAEQPAPGLTAQQQQQQPAAGDGRAAAACCPSPSCPAVELAASGSGALNPSPSQAAAVAGRTASLSNRRRTKSSENNSTHGTSENNSTHGTIGLEPSLQQAPLAAKQAL